MEQGRYMFDKRPLVLKGVALAEMIELVVQVLVDLARGAILDEEPTENAKAPHPENLTTPFWSVHLAPIPTRFHASHGGGSHVGIRAFAVPFRLPNPRWRPMVRAALSSRARARECMVTGLRMMRPSDTSLRMVWRELAWLISCVSFGSSQILRWPQPTTDAARRFWVVRFTLDMARVVSIEAPATGKGRIAMGGQPTLLKPPR